MNRKTLDIIALLVAALVVCVGMFLITMPGNETVGLYLVGGAVTAALLTILIPTRNIEKKGDST